MPGIQAKIIADHLVERHIKLYEPLHHSDALKEAIADAIQKTLNKETAWWVYDEFPEFYIK